MIFFFKSNNRIDYKQSATPGHRLSALPAGAARACLEENAERLR